MSVTQMQKLAQTKKARHLKQLMRLTTGLFAVLAIQPALAQITPDQEYAKFVERGKAVSPMTEFGEQVNLRDGALVVRATDIELPGIGPTIRLTRSFKPNRGPVEYYHETSGNGFGEWELEIPRIKTMTPNALGVKSASPKGWQVMGSNETDKNKRCSRFSAPDNISFNNDTARYWRAYEWWDGYYLVDGSGSDQPLMSRNTGNGRRRSELSTHDQRQLACGLRRHHSQRRARRGLRGRGPRWHQIHLQLPRLQAGRDPAKAALDGR